MTVNAMKSKKINLLVAPFSSNKTAVGSAYYDHDDYDTL